MAKRRSKDQIAADKVIKKQLNIVGEKIYQEAKANSRVRTGRLRDSVNYMVKPDTTLTVAQVYYGKYQDPNELLESVKRHIPEATKLIVKEINDQLLNNFKTMKK